MTNKLLSIFFIFLLTSCSFGPLPDCEGTPLNLKPGQKIHQASSPSWNECKAKMTNSKGGIFTLIYKNGKVSEGILKYANGEVYDGQVSLRTEDDKIIGTVPHGQGTYTWANGDQYVGEFKEMQPHGQGTYTFVNGNKYVGEFKDAQPHGQVTATYANGDQYVGEFKDGKRNGQGTYTYGADNESIADEYVGEFKDDLKHGKGTETYTNGHKYVGEYKDDLRNGKGTYTMPDGYKFVGEFKDGKRNGQGTYTYANGDKYVGKFKDDKRHGQGTMTYTDGNQYVGEFKNGKYHGQGTYTYANGHKYVGEWKDDKRNGQGTYTFTDGTFKKGTWKSNNLVFEETMRTSYAQIDSEVGCESKYSDQKKMDIFHSKYKGKSFRWSGRVRNPERGLTSLDIDGRLSDLRIYFSDGQTGYDLLKDQTITVVFVMHELGGCVLPFIGRNAYID
jgi:hypothetical protein